MLITFDLSRLQFIDYATGGAGKGIGHKLRSFTAKITITKTLHPIDGSEVAFVDTPGFDDTFKSDVEILYEVAACLVDVYVVDAYNQVDY